jgi:hypothetical protein
MVVSCPARSTFPRLEPLAGHDRHAELSFQQTQEEYMRKSLAVFLSGVALVIAASTARAGEQVLEFKLVTKPIDFKITEVANIEGQTVASGKIFGVAVFKDGRIGVKEFVNSSDLLKGSGPFFGYSTYTFEDGSITARYTGSVKDGRSTGEYTILSGTGAYANATGTGTIESAPNPFKGVNLLNIKLVVKTPGT